MRRSSGDVLVDAAGASALAPAVRGRHAAHRARLDERRWHFQHGPIDLVIGADGDRAALAIAHDRAWRRFETVLDELVMELPTLKTRVSDRPALTGIVARRMEDACRPHRERFITPMAAVAGAVADEVIGCYRRPGIARAWVNNGGDIALHLVDGASMRIGLFADLGRFDVDRHAGRVDVDGGFTIDASTPVRGVATSGWRGRSFSLGIADSVTVLARTSAEADAAATMVANAVDVDDARIVRRPASSLKDDSDLGDRLVTVDVPHLDRDVVDRALARGVAHAEALRDRGLIEAAVLVCQRAVAWTGGSLDADRLESWHAPRPDASRDPVAASRPSSFVR